MSRRSLLRFQYWFWSCRGGPYSVFNIGLGHVTPVSASSFMCSSVITLQPARYFRTIFGQLNQILFFVKTWKRSMLVIYKQVDDNVDYVRIFVMDYMDIYLSYSLFIWFISFTVVIQNVFSPLQTGQLWLDLYKNDQYQVTGYAHNSQDYASASNAIVLQLAQSTRIHNRLFGPLLSLFVSLLLFVSFFCLQAMLSVVCSPSQINYSPFKTLNMSYQGSHFTYAHFLTAGKATVALLLAVLFVLNIWSYGIMDCTSMLFTLGNRVPKTRGVNGVAFFIPIGKQLQ